MYPGSPAKKNSRVQFSAATRPLIAEPDAIRSADEVEGGLTEPTRLMKLEVALARAKAGQG